MEIFEIRYFLGVAQEQNIHRAAEQLHVSPGSLSKAIARLEEELQVSLFSREGRNIRITDHGRLLQKRAAEIIRLEEATRLEISGHEGSLQIVLAGPEILLSNMGLSVSESLKTKYPKSQFAFHSASEEEALGRVDRGEAHLALVTGDVASFSDLTVKVIAETHFRVVVGQGHPLYTKAKTKKTIAVEDLLTYPFASPNHPLLGKVGQRQSLDGWRDDQFPRKIEYLTSSLKLLEELVSQGRALAYLPDYYAEGMQVEPLKITGCPYTCTQKVKLVAKNPKDRSWLNQWF